ncbi:hypothetical protein PSACC_03231 [Paramicrosporidium saccamoebae]|uniref:J domain-containing protein n=1 Tax=Paramicrosporidium saccamoebae TaxID=1246581 RepID=A0A2H9TH59_9FUNG|nr:hypothetical protein PSACC_03231 [Paramicrosporidium saccamoebae]
MAEANRDEAARCEELSRRFFDQKEYTLAAKYAEKSVRLYETAQSLAWLSTVRQTLSEPAPPRPAESKSPQDSKSASHAQTPQKTKPLDSNTYTKEQAEGMALQFHPDKNHAPGADEAFKVVSRAFSCLSDTSKKTQYDQFGSEEPAGFSGVRFRRTARPMNFEGEISPEELFNMFFNGGFEGAHFQSSGFPPMFVHHFHSGGQRARRRQKHQEQPLSWIAIALQIIPVAIVGLFLFLGSFLGTSNASTDTWDAYSRYISLSRTSSHTHQMATEKNAVPYWATTDYQKYFSRGNQRELRVYEEAVERQYLVEIQKKCQEEELDLQKRKVNAKTREELERLQMEKCPSCDKLHSYSV